MNYGSIFLDTSNFKYLTVQKQRKEILEKAGLSQGEPRNSKPASWKLGSCETKLQMQLGVCSEHNPMILWLCPHYHIHQLNSKHNYGFAVNRIMITFWHKIIFKWTKEFNSCPKPRGDQSDTNFRGNKNTNSYRQIVVLC